MKGYKQEDVLSYSNKAVCVWQWQDAPEFLTIFFDKKEDYQWMIYIPANCLSQSWPLQIGDIVQSQQDWISRIGHIDRVLLADGAVAAAIY